MKAMRLLIALCLLPGCNMIHQMMPAQREAEQRAQQLQDVNLRVMRFSDEYAGRIREVMTRFQTTTSIPEERLAAQNWKVQQIESAYTIASGRNPVSNALDMVVLATLSRLVLDDLWVQDLYGDRARPAHEVHLKLEAGAWQLVHDILNDSQIAQLKQIIARWREENPNVRAVAYIHFLDFAHSIGSPGPGDERNPGNLFAMVGLDPFTQLDPAIQEVTQTRELAERAIFYMQRAPRLLDMQVERITYQLAVMPESKSLLTSIDRAALVGTAADRIAGELPDLLAREREALVSQVMQSLHDEQQTLGALSGDLRATLEAGTATADSLHATLETFDRIAARYQRKPETPQKAQTSRPFDIREYVQLVRELTLTTKELNTLAQRMDAALPAVRGATDAAADRFEQMLNRVFVLAMVLVVVTIGSALAAALIYRVVVNRMNLAPK